MVASYKCRMCIFLGQTPGSAHDCGEGEDDGPQSGKTLGPRRKYSTTPISIGKKFEWENCIEILFGSLNSEPIDRKIWVPHFEFYGPLSPFTDLPHTNQESGSLSLPLLNWDYESQIGSEFRKIVLTWVIINNFCGGGWTLHSHRSNYTRWSKKSDPWKEIWPRKWLFSIRIW